MTNTIITLSITVLALIYAIYRLLKEIKKKNKSLENRTEQTKWFKELNENLSKGLEFSLNQSQLENLKLKQEIGQLKNKQSYLLIEIAELKKGKPFISSGAKSVRSKRKNYPNKKLKEGDIKFIKTWYKMVIHNNN